MRIRKTRGVLAGLLCPIVLLASCATSQKITNGTDEMWASNNNSSAQEQTTAFRSGAWTYYETYYGKETAERLLRDESGPNDEQGTYPQDTESEEPDGRPILVDVTLGVLTVLLVTVGVGYVLPACLGDAIFKGESCLEGAWWQ